MSAEIVQVRFEDVDLSVRPSAEHEWLLTTAEVAAGLGVSEDSVYQMKSRRSAELVDGRHFVTVADPDTDGQSSLTIRQGGPARTLWTKRGVIRLGFWARSARARRFRDWAEDLIIAAEAVAPVHRLPQSYSEALRELASTVEERDAARAELEVTRPKAEKFAAIQAGSGLTLRMFHKKYFSTVPERVFMEHLYGHDFLIDQRGKGAVDEKTGKRRAGSQHRHPTFRGKPFLYLHGDVDDGGTRRENTRVLPGDPELALRNLLAGQGLPANDLPTQPDLFEDGAA